MASQIWPIAFTGAQKYGWLCTSVTLAGSIGSWIDNQWIWS